MVVARMRVDNAVSGGPRAGKSAREGMHARGVIELWLYRRRAGLLYWPPDHEGTPGFAAIRHGATEL